MADDRQHLVLTNNLLGNLDRTRNVVLVVVLDEFDRMSVDTTLLINCIDGGHGGAGDFTVVALACAGIHNGEVDGRGWPIDQEVAGKDSREKSERGANHPAAVASNLSMMWCCELIKIEVLRRRLGMAHEHRWLDSLDITKVGKLLGLAIGRVKLLGLLQCELLLGRVIAQCGHPLPGRRILLVGT